MNKEIIIQPSEQLAYWIGLVQADGSVTKWTKKTGKIKYYLEFCNNFLILIKEFQRGLQYLNRSSRYIRKINSNSFESKISVNSLLSTLDSLKISRSRKYFEPPEWVTNDQSFFGAYLGGIIDGDGDIRVKPKTNQCVIRITSGHKEFILRELIKKFLKCSVTITKRHRKTFYRGRFINGKWFELEFLVSSKNLSFLLTYILPYIKLDYKREKLIKFIESKYALAGI